MVEGQVWPVGGDVVDEVRLVHAPEDPPEMDVVHEIPRGEHPVVQEVKDSSVSTDHPSLGPTSAPETGRIGTGDESRLGESRFPVCRGRDRSVGVLRLAQKRSGVSVGRTRTDAGPCQLL